MGRFIKVLFVTTTLTFTSACGNLNAINKRFNPNNHQSISIDAEQRVVYSVEKKVPSGATWTAVCAEPSPDAISALSASFGADVESFEKALNLAGGSQKSAASIGLRTQTIQILRDAMYRLCEGYASGALDNVKYGQAQRRYQDTMLALLAIEQLTGAVVANQAAISSSADSVSSRGVESLN